jgi:hypothetical protein
MTPPARSRKPGTNDALRFLGDEMTEKLSARWFYALVLSIVVLMTGFVAVGVRAFASALISDSIYLGAFGILLMFVPIYFILRRPVAVTPMGHKIRRLLSARSEQVSQQMVLGRKDRRRLLPQGQVAPAVAHERRSKQPVEIHVVSLEPLASESLRP